jgi:Cu(I)/Ag(I) efflux system protein CusF
LLSPLHISFNQKKLSKIDSFIISSKEVLLCLNYENYDLVATIATLSACSKNEASEQKTSAAPMEQMSHEKAEMVQAVGVITAIDTKGSILTLSHEAIAAIKWPAMTMGFKVADPQLLNGLAVGQKVDFELKAEGGNQVITNIKPKK